MKKRIYALLLSAVMLGTSVPVLPAAAADTPAYTAEAVEMNDTLTEFLARIAGWENCTPADCLVLKDDLSCNVCEILTPTKNYTIQPRYTVSGKLTGYFTGSRVNTSSNYCLRFRVSGTELPVIEGGELSDRFDEGAKPDGYYYLRLESGKYADYFAAAKKLLALGSIQVTDLSFCAMTTELADDSPEAFISIPAQTENTEPSGADGTDLAEEAVLNDFLTRIAGWDDAALSECFYRKVSHDSPYSYNYGVLYTPKKAYDIEKYSFGKYRITADTPLDEAEVREQLRTWMTARGNSENYIEQTCSQCTVSQAEDGYWSVSADTDFLKTLPAVRRVEMAHTYHTSGRVNYFTCSALRITCDREPTAADFPALSGVTISKEGEFLGAPAENIWYLTLPDADYSTYFEAAKYVRTLDFVKDWSLAGMTTALADESPESSSEPFYWETLYDRNAKDCEPRLTEFLTRLAREQGVTLDDCTVLPHGEGAQLLTPEKLYDADRLRFSAYEAGLDTGTVLDADAVTAKWRAMLKEAGYPNADSAPGLRCELEQNGYYSYLVTAGQESYKGLTLLDCLKTFFQVKKVYAAFGYRTDDRVNTASNYYISFRSDRALTEADLPALESITLKAGADSLWQLNLNLNDNYADYVSTVNYLQTLDSVSEIHLDGIKTALADESKESRLEERSATLLYERKNLVLPVFGDHTTNDPLFGSYLYGDRFLEGKAELPKDGKYYFTGQIFMRGTEIPDLPQLKALHAMYCPVGAAGHFFWREDAPLSVEEAEQLCAEINAYYEASGADFYYKPSPVYVRGLPGTVTGDITAAGISGFISSDNKVTVKDAKQLLDICTQYLMTEEQPVPLIQTLPNADVNGDGDINITDAKYILDYAVYTDTFETPPAWSDIIA